MGDRVVFLRAESLGIQARTNRSRGKPCVGLTGRLSREPERAGFGTAAIEREEHEVFGSETDPKRLSCRDRL